MISEGIANRSANYQFRDLLARHEKRHTPARRTEATIYPLQTVRTEGRSIARSLPDDIDPVENFVVSDLLNVPHISNIAEVLEQTPDHVPVLMRQQGTPGCNLDLLSDAADQLASLHSQTQEQSVIRGLLPPERENGLGDEGRGDVRLDGGFRGEDNNIAIRNPLETSLGGSGYVDDHNSFLDAFDWSSHFLPPTLGAEYAIPFWSSTREEQELQNRPEPVHLESGRHISDEWHDKGGTSFSRFGSRLPSLQPEPRGQSSNRLRSPEDFSKSGPCWKFSSHQYRQVLVKLEGFAAVLPKNFAPPSRHAMSRFLEGCIKGLFEHLPFLHIPTFSVVDAAPELLLAMVAIGAQFRFESHRGNSLFYAAKAIAMEQIRRRNNRDVPDSISSTSSHRLGSVPVSTTSGSMLENSRLGNRNSNVESGCPGQPASGKEIERDRKGQLQTLQALLSLMVMGSWGTRELIREVLSLQSLLAVLVREDGLADMDKIEPPPQSFSAIDKPESASWLSWAWMESRKRTKLMIYCFFNLQCVAYNTPPLIVTSEFACYLPRSAQEWKAETLQQWDESQRCTKIAEASFQDSFASLFHGSGAPEPNALISSLGNYVLISALLQRIFFLRQARTGCQIGTVHNNLRSEDIDELSHALQCWQAGWQGTPESSLEPQSPSGPVAFNSTALLRLAWIRLHSDLGLSRNLASRDPVLLAAAFNHFPPLQRGPRLSHTILQAAHALSIPVRIGINFVARTQSFSWSMQHSLCNLECAIFLSKWLEKVAMSVNEEPLTPEETSLINVIRGVLQETEMFMDDARSDTVDEDQHNSIQQLGIAVVRVWAETFKGTHVFDVVNTIGESLRTYAELLEETQYAANG